MMYQQLRKTLSIIIVLCICATLAVCTSRASAKQSEASVLINKPTTIDEGPALPPPAKSSANAPANADKPTTRTSNRPFMRPAEPREPARGQLTAGPEPMPVPAHAERHVVEKPIDSGPLVHPTPPIDYDTHRSARRM